VASVLPYLLSLSRYNCSPDTSRRFFHPHKQHLKLQLELPSRWSLDLFDTENLLVLSNLPYLHWLACHHRNHFPFFTHGDFFHPYKAAPQNTIRTPFHVITRPIRRGKSAGVVHFTVALSVGVPSSKIFPTFNSRRFFHRHKAAPQTAIRTPFQVVSRPIQRGESIGVIHFTVSAIVSAPS